MNDYLAEAKAAAQSAYTAAEIEYRQAYAAHKTAHRAAIAELVEAELPTGTDVLAWMRVRTGPAWDRLNAADMALNEARIEELAIEAAEHAEAEAAKAQAVAAKARKDAVRYVDKLDEVRDLAEVAFGLASRVHMQLNPDVKEVRIR